jgi:two-component system sensor kinase FixL
MKSRFISMASHEFRTPLTTIESSADLIARYEESHQQEKRLKHISRIKTSVQNLTNILNDFLSLEKLESGVINLN